MVAAENRREEKKPEENKPEEKRFTLVDANVGLYGIPTSCACGGRIIDEVPPNACCDTLPGRRYFTCIYYEDDGLHYSQPWVHGIEEEVNKLNSRMDVVEQIIWGVQYLNKEHEQLKEQVETLNSRAVALEKLYLEY